MKAWQNTPFKIDVKKGEKWAFCSCGFSDKGPVCDGSHAKMKTGKSPFVIDFDKDRTLYACGCKTSKNRPYCDSSHKQIAL